jgi:hypothetical protein
VAISAVVPTAVVVPTTTVIVVPAGAEVVVAVVSVPVASPARVPEVAGAPLRERPRLGLGDGGINGGTHPRYTQGSSKG